MNAATRLAEEPGEKLPSMRVVEHGDDLAIVMPRKVAEQFGFAAGAEAQGTIHEGRLHLRPAVAEESRYEQQMALARKIMRKHREALAELAK